jgi:hypothetical protein
LLVIVASGCEDESKPQPVPSELPAPNELVAHINDANALLNADLLPEHGHEHEHQHAHEVDGAAVLDEINAPATVGRLGVQRLPDPNEIIAHLNGGTTRFVPALIPPGTTSSPESWWVDASSYATLGDAVNAAQTEGKTLVISTEISVDTNLQIPISVPVQFVGQGRLLVDNSSTVRILGPMQAPLWQVFYFGGPGVSAGSQVILGPQSVSVVLPQWWGARGDDQEDDTVAIQRAIDQAAEDVTVGRQIFLPAGKYYVSSLVLRNNTSLRGEGPRHTTIRPLAGSNAPYLLTIQDGPLLGIELADLFFEAAAPANANQGVMRFTAQADNSPAEHGGIWYANFRRLRLRGFDGVNIWLEGGTEDYQLPHQFIHFEEVNVFRACSDTSVSLRLSGQVQHVSLVNSSFDTFLGCTSGTNVEIGVTDNPGGKTGNIQFINCSVQKGDLGIDLIRAENIIFNQTWFENLNRTIRVDLGKRIFIERSDVRNAALLGPVLEVISNQADVVFRENYVLGTTHSLIDAPNLTSIQVENNWWNTVTSGSLTAGITRQISVSGNAVQLEYSKTAYVNSSAQQIATIESKLLAGEQISLRAHVGSITFNESGNIRLGGRSSPLVVPSGALVTFVRADLGGDLWHLMSLSSG